MLPSQHMYNHQQHYSGQDWQSNRPSQQHNQSGNNAAQQQQFRNLGGPGIDHSGNNNEPHRSGLFSTHPSNNNNNNPQHPQDNHLPPMTSVSSVTGSSTANNNTTSAAAAAAAIAAMGMNDENKRILEWIAQMLRPDSKESALLELSKKREQVPELALILWYSFGVMTSLLQEIISVYPLLNPSQLTAAASNRVCNALALLQCVASHGETRALFLGAHIPLFLYPFLNTTSKSRPFEYLRLTSLGVIGALVKNDSSEVINFLLTTEIIPLCLRIMETGSELSKTVAIFIVQKILLDDLGLQYICQTYERFYAVGTVLSNMVTQLVEQQTVRLLKHVVRCFLRLSDNARAREALRQCLPEPLRDATFSSVLRDDAATKRCLAQLLLALSDQVVDPTADNTNGVASTPNLMTQGLLNQGIGGNLAGLPSNNGMLSMGGMGGLPIGMQGYTGQRQT